MTGISVSQEGTTIRLSVQIPQSGSRLLLEFDERYGGMITHYRYDSRHVRAGGEADDVSEEWQMQWATRDGRLVPVRRVAMMEVMRNGELSQREQCDITFKTFLIEAVRPEELTIENMGITAGTRVVDNVENKDWTYGRTGGR